MDASWVARRATTILLTFRLSTSQTEYSSIEPQYVLPIRKTYQYRLIPTPEQAGVLETVLWHCRTLYTVAREQRRTWWGRGQGKSATYYQHATEPPEPKAACPQFAAVHAQVVQDVLRRVDTTYQAFFRRA